MNDSVVFWDILQNKFDDMNTANRSLISRCDCSRIKEVLENDILFLIHPEGVGGSNAQ